MRVLWRVEACSGAMPDGSPLCSPHVASQRFQRHKELLVRRGWKSLQWCAGARQSISIVRTSDGQDRRRLTNNEFDLATTVAVGFGLKQSAAELGLGWATARTTISRALRKLGLRSCAQVPAFWYGLSGAVSFSRAGDGTELLVFESRLDVTALAVPLTSAERDVLQAALLGLNSQQIARNRSASVRTVAKQLATLFQKFSVSSKAELASKALLLHSSCDDSR
jgi:DNA-binding CsgD family transcriptional regulator